MEKGDLKQLQQEVTKLRAEGKYKETIEAGYNLLDMGIKENDYKSILVAYLNNAASYYCIGDIEEAFNNIEAYEEYCSQYGDDADQLSLNNVLFLLFEYNKDFEKAKQTLEKTIDLGKRLERYNIVSNGYSNYSHVCIVEGKYEHALKMAKKGLEMAKLHQPASLILELRVKLNIALAYIELEDFLTARAIINEINSPLLDDFIREKSQFHILLGKWYSKQKFYKEAFESFTYAKELVEGYHDLYLLKVIQEDRCKLCEEMSDILNGYLVQKEYISLLKDISNQELALKALKLDIKHSISAIEKKANTDYLTGLYNRDFLEQTTNKWIHQETMADLPLVCIAFDIDNFKGINDVYGHLSGDEVIKQVGQTCLKVVGDNGLVGRYGGDEFVIILQDNSLERGMQLAKQIGKALKELQITINNTTISLSASIGLADESMGAVRNFKDLFYLADLALYKAKQNGKNQICLAR